MKRTHSSRRSGFTLIELLIVMTVWAVVLSVLGVLLGRWFHVGSTLRMASQQQSDLLRLQRQFVTDARRANSFETPENAVVRLSLEPDHSITYLQKNTMIQRVEHHGEEIVHREGYRLASGARLRVERMDSDSTLIQLRITSSDGDSSNASSPKVFLVAPLAADHRYERSAASGANP